MISSKIKHYQINLSYRLHSFPVSLNVLSGPKLNRSLCSSPRFGYHFFFSRRPAIGSIIIIWYGFSKSPTLEKKHRVVVGHIIFYLKSLKQWCNGNLSSWQLFGVVHDRKTYFILSTGFLILLILFNIIAGCCF